mgnify:CR=1 FL=1
MSEKRTAKDLLGIDDNLTDDTMSILNEFPELSKVVSVEGKMLVQDEPQVSNDWEGFPFDTASLKMKNMTDQQVVTYLESLELSAEVGFAFILDISGADGMNRIRKCLNSQEELRKMEIEMIPLLMQTQLIDFVENELESRGLLKEFRENHPFVHYVEQELVVYEHYHDRMIDLLAMFGAGYIDDNTIMFIIDTISENMHAQKDKKEEQNQEKASL